MVTEFFGLPGSGKTYLSRMYAKRNNAYLVEVGGRFERYFWSAFFACVHPAVFFSFLKIIVRENKHDMRLLRYKIHTLYFNTIAKEGKRFFSGKDAVLDEGFSQAILSLYERELGKEDLAPFFLFLKERKIYMVNASLAIREKRICERARAPRAFRDDEYRRNWHTMLEKNYMMMNEWMKECSLCEEINNG